MGKDNRWIQNAINPATKGALHNALHVAQGAKIPMSKLKKAEHSNNKLLAQRARFAATLRKLNHKK
jgi:hypothetical protein